MKIKIKTKGMQGTEVKMQEPTISKFDDLENATEEELLDSLKQLFEQEKKERLKQLNLLFNANHYLSADFILDALMAKLEGELEENEIDDHMRSSAEIAMSQMDSLYVSWLNW